MLSYHNVTGNECFSASFFFLFEQNSIHGFMKFRKRPSKNFTISRFDEVIQLACA